MCCIYKSQINSIFPKKQTSDLNESDAEQQLVHAEQPECSL